MTRTVVPNAQVCHLWAHQSQDYARSANGNVSFSGRDLFSYNTVIATIYKSQDIQGGIALVTSQNYSPTTVKQKSNVYHALRYGTFMLEFTVPFIGRPGGRAPYIEWQYKDDPAAMHLANAESFLESFRDDLARYKRARQPGEWIANSARCSAEQFNRYRSYFKVPLPALDDYEAQITAAVQERIKIEEAKNTPEYKAKQEKERAARFARETRDYREVRGKFPADMLDHWGEIRKKFTQDDRDYRAERLRVIFADKVDAWMNGSNVQLPRMESALLRVQGRNIQTSWGALFPLEHGAKAFPLIRRCHDTQTQWSTNGHTIHLGPFKIDRITECGDVIAGCHRVEWPAIERIAIQLGLWESGL